MTNLYTQLVNIIGEPTNDVVEVVYFIICGFIVIFVLKLIVSLFFRFVLGIKR